MSEAELVDVVDLADTVVGSVPRGRLRDGGLNFRVVHVLASDARGWLILQRVAPREGARFTHGSSVAGHVRAGESYAAAAVREFIEELGVEPPELRSLGVTWLDEPDRRKFIGVFVARVRAPLRPDPEEVAAIETMPVAEVRRLLREMPRMFSETFARVFRHVDSADGWP